MQLFNQIRPRDINLEIAISNREQKTADYYVFDETAFNSLSFAKAADIKGKAGSILKDNCEVQVAGLNQVLEEHQDKFQSIDFLNIDTELHEMEVLLSLDLNRYRPKFILVEVKDRNMNNIDDDGIYNYLYDFKYRISSKLFNTAIFEDSK